MIKSNTIDSNESQEDIDIEYFLENDINSDEERKKIFLSLTEDELDLLINYWRPSDNIVVNKFSNNIPLDEQEIRILDLILLILLKKRKNKLKEEKRTDKVKSTIKWIIDNMK